MPTFSLSWNTAASPNGSHTLTAVATDFAGNQTTSSAVVVTSSNSAVSTEPVTPPPPPTTEPTATQIAPISIGVLFYNTLGEFSLFANKAVFPSAIDPDSQELVNDEWVNVRDTGAVGDGETDDTTAIQAALDAASTRGKKVLIPAGFTFRVSFPNMDPWEGGYWGQMAHSLWVDDNAQIMLEGKIEPYYGGDTSAIDFCTGATIFANRHSFRFLSGAAGSAGDYFPESYTGDRQGLDETGGVHTNGVPSTTLQLTGSPDLSDFVPGAYVPPVEGVFFGLHRDLSIRLGADPWQSAILSVDDTNKTVTVADTFDIPSGSPVAYTIENNRFNQNIHIFGHGSVDWTHFNSTTPVNKFNYSYWLGRFYRVKNLTIEDITVRGCTSQGVQIGFSQYVNLNRVTFKDMYENGSSFDVCAALDVCRHVVLRDCLCYDNPIGIGFFLWACRNVKVINCLARDMPYWSVGVGGIVQHQGYGQEFLVGHPTNLVKSRTNDEGFDIDPEIWNMHDFGTLTMQTVGDAVDWNILVDGCTSHRNGYGMTLLSETYYGGFGRGVTVTNNHITSNKFVAIGLGSTYGFIFDKNHIKDNGFGGDPSRLYSADKPNYTSTASGARQPYFD